MLTSTHKLRLIAILIDDPKAITAEQADELGRLLPGEWRDVPPPQKPSQRSRGRLRH